MSLEVLELSMTQAFDEGLMDVLNWAWDEPVRAGSFQQD